MSTATRTRRGRRKPATAKIGKEAWQVVTPAGDLITQRDSKTHSDGAVVNWAQHYAERHDGEIELFVQLSPLFGEPDRHYRIIQDEDGVVLTWRI